MPAMKEYKADLTFTPKEYHRYLLQAFVIGMLAGIGLTCVALIIYFS